MAEIHLKCLENGLILGIGMYLHVQQVSILEFKYSRLPGLQPNKASVIFIFSVLCVLAIIRPFWPSVLRSPPRAIRFVLELTITLSMTELILRQFWIPLLRFLAHTCTFLSQYMIILNRDLFYSKVPALSIWVREEFFYFIRMLMALGFLYIMIQVTGLLEIANDYITLFIGEDFQATTGGRGVRRMESPARLMRRRLWDDEDTPSTSPKRRSSRSRSRRRSRSRSRRRTRIYFDNAPEEIYC